VLDLVLAALVFPLLVALALAALAVVTLVPFVTALQMARTRCFSTARWGALALGGIGVGLAVAAYAVLREDRSPAWVLLGVPFAYAAPLALLLLEPGHTAVGGRAGAHEQLGPQAALGPVAQPDAAQAAARSWSSRKRLRSSPPA
jgi:hypothetical protein